MSVSFSGQLFPNTQSLEIPGPITGTKNKSVLTGMCWIRLTKTPTEVGDDINFLIHATNDASQTQIRYKFKMRLAGPSMSLDVGGRALTSDSLLFADSAANAVSVGPWFHVAGALDYSASRAFYYVNGALFDTQPMNGTFGAAQTNNADGQRGRIGSILDGDSEPMAGLIEDIRLYDHHSAAEILTIFTAKGKDGIVAGLLERFQMRDRATGNATAVNGVAEQQRKTAVGNRNPTFSADTITAFTRHRNRGRR